jgi:hypothetical protein
VRGHLTRSEGTGLSLSTAAPSLPLAVLALRVGLLLSFYLLPLALWMRR